jgi:hypothetical protein
MLSQESLTGEASRGDRARGIHARVSTFMGHVDPSSTAVYLTITPALLDEANRRFDTFAESAWRELETER